MDLKIIEVVYANKAEMEFVLLEVLKNTNLQDYELHGETYYFKAIFHPQRNFFRFPALEVKQGDKIRVYTGSINSETIDSTAHCFYRGLNECLWKESDKGRLLWIKSPHLNSELYNATALSRQARSDKGLPASSAGWFNE